MKTMKSLLENLGNSQFLVIASSLATVKELFGKYVFSDHSIAIGLAVLVAIDTIIGLLNAWNNGTLDAKAFRQIFQKVILYGCALITMYVLINHVGAGAIPEVFNSAVYSIMMAHEGLSILEKIAEMRPDLFPVVVLKRLKNFDENGKLKVPTDDQPK